MKGSHLSGLLPSLLLGCARRRRGLTAVTGRHAGLPSFGSSPETGFLDGKSRAWGKKTAFGENSGKPRLPCDRFRTITLPFASSISASIAGVKFCDLTLSCHQEKRLPFPQLWHEPI